MCSRAQVEFFADSAPTRISRFIPNSFRQNDEEYAPTLPDFFPKAPQIHFYP
jgi:hypothetical protein